MWMKYKAKEFALKVGKNMENMLSRKQDSKKNNFCVESLLETPGEYVAVLGAGATTSVQRGWVAGTVSPTKHKVLQEQSVFSRARVSISGSVTIWSL